MGNCVQKADKPPLAVDQLGGSAGAVKNTAKDEFSSDNEGKYFLPNMAYTLFLGWTGFQKKTQTSTSMKHVDEKGDNNRQS